MNERTDSVNKAFKFNEIDTLVFPGGGNRCWWQAGLISALIRSDFKLPADIIGCSAGAAMAAALISDRMDEALGSCKSLYRENSSTLSFRKGYVPLPEFAQKRIYPEWIRSFLGLEELARIKRFGGLSVAVSRLDKSACESLAVSQAVCRFLLKKRYPQNRACKGAPKIGGFTQVFLDLSAQQNLAEALILMEATAAAAPVIPGRTICGARYFDGGYIAPVPVLMHQTQQARKKTLILLTKHNSAKPTVFTANDRWFVQPSQPIPVATWGCVGNTTVDEAFLLGQRDALQIPRQ